MKISKRLKSIASMVDCNTSFIDVGCDHALLTIYLVSNKCINKAIASDINDGPLEKAKENIQKYNLEDKIKVVKQDGIKELDSDIDTVIISGMGGILIKDILENGDLSNVKNIIVSPNNDIELVRRSIVKYGFLIDKEAFIKDIGKYYNIISFKKGNGIYSFLEYKYGPILLKNINGEYSEYLSDLLNKNNDILKVLPKKYILKKIFLMKEIKEIKRII